jgi:hypothetical protein
VGEKLEESEEDDELRTVDEIRKSGRRNKRKQYLVHYENAPLDEWVWEFRESLRGVNADKVREFELCQRLAKDTN